MHWELSRAQKKELNLGCLVGKQDEEVHHENEPTSLLRVPIPRFPGFISLQSPTPHHQ